MFNNNLLKTGSNGMQSFGEFQVFSFQRIYNSEIVNGSEDLKGFLTFPKKISTFEISHVHLSALDRDLWIAVPWLNIKYHELILIEKWFISLHAKQAGR